MLSSNVYNALSSAHAAAANDVRYHCVASLALLVWDYIVVLDDEVEYVWTMCNKGPFKWIYLILRYGVIVAHVTHNLLFSILANTGNPPMMCRMWYSYVVALAQTTQTLLELILSYRVFALYNRSKKVALLLAILILVEVGGTIRLLYLGDAPGFYGTCLLQAVDKESMKQSILGFIVHCTIIALTLFKYFFALRAGWGRTPLVSLVVRDNSLVYCSIVFLLTTVVVVCGLYNEQAVAVFYWATAMTSFSGCRMILGMERFARLEASAATPDQLFLTSEFSLRTIESDGRHNGCAS